jgi:peptidoglycan/LPS O-acetylase OafA/YrhL
MSDEKSRSAAPLKVLTFLRFIAASAIVVCHCVSLFRLPPVIEPLNLTLAVSFFFVLSGFILAYVHPQISNRTDVFRFWRARFARCWPVHMLDLLLFAFVCPYGLGYTAAGYPRFDTFLAQILLVQSWIPSPVFFFSFNSPAWSVSVEYFFYFCFPLILLLKRRISGSWCLIFVLLTSLVLASICSFLEQTLHGQNVQVWGGYINPLARLFEFVLGMCCAFFLSGEANKTPALRATVMQVLALVLLASTFWFMQPIMTVCYSLKYFPEQVLFAILWSFVICSFSLNEGLLARISGHKIAVKLGEISFAIYMLHSLVSHAGRSFWESLVAIDNYPAFALYCLAVLVLSFLVHEFFERPARNSIMGKKNAYG